MRSDLLEKTIAVQKQASDPQSSAWVFASAGSGKTKVLVDRLLRLLLDGVVGSKILCVTFTKVAANEMQERVLKELQNWSVISQNNLKKKVSDLTDSYVDDEKLNLAANLYSKSFADENKIKIVTIHSLCQDILRIFPFEAGVNPNFEIMDQMLEQDLLQKSKSEVFKNAFVDKKLADIIGDISKEVSQEELLSLVAKFLSHKEKYFKLKDVFGNIEIIFDKILQNLGLNQQLYQRDNFTLFKKELDESEIAEIVSSMESEDSLKATDKKFLSFFLEYMKASYDEFLLGSRSIFVTQQGDAKKNILTKKFEHHIDYAKKLQQEFIEFYDLENSIITAKLTFFALQLVDKILQKYQDIKNANSNIDYGDLIIKTQKLLNNTQYKDWVRYRLDGFFDHILIDESQDTNDDQWSIIEVISEEFFLNRDSKINRSIFVIGDEKQSIFSFQGANPEISYQKFMKFAKMGQDCNKEVKNLFLNSSFRSTDKVLNFVDDIFCENSDFIKTQYLSHNALRPSTGSVSLWPRFFEKEGSKAVEMVNFKKSFLNGGGFVQSDKFKKDLAAYISNEIRSWIEKGREIEVRADKELPRSIRYSDIMIVLRNQTNGFAEALKSEFVNNKVPFDGDRNINFLDNLILLDLVSILRFSLFAVDDLNLAALLKSPFFRVSEKEIFQICEVKNHLNISIFEVIFYSAKKFANNKGFEFEYDYFGDQEVLDSELITPNEFYLNLNKKLCDVIASYKESSILEFYIQILDKNFSQNFISEFSVDDKKVVDEFLVFVAQIIARGQINGHEFLKYIDESNPSLMIKQESADSVKISTIHSAKGLQKPIVIIPDCCFSFNKMPSVKENLIWLRRYDDFNGFYELPIWLARKKNSSKILDIELENRSKMLKNEYLRLFYVALTRAENELFIAGFGNDNDSDSWYDIAQKIINKKEND